MEPFGEHEVAPAVGEAGAGEVAAVGVVGADDGADLADVFAPGELAGGVNEFGGDGGVPLAGGEFEDIHARAFGVPAGPADHGVAHECAVIGGGCGWRAGGRGGVGGGPEADDLELIVGAVVVMGEGGAPEIF